MPQAKWRAAPPTNSRRTVPNRKAKPSSSPPTLAAKCAVKWATDTICSKMNLPKQPTGDKCKTQWAENIRKNPNELRYAARDADRMADKVLQHDKQQLRLPSEQSRSLPRPRFPPSECSRPNATCSNSSSPSAKPPR